MNACLYKSKMEHYLDGRLSGRDQEEVAQHVLNCQACQACQAELQILEQVEELFRANREGIFPRPPFEYWENATAAIVRGMETRNAPVAHRQKGGLQKLAAGLMAMLNPSPVRIGLIGLASLALIFVLVGRNQFPREGVKVLSSKDAVPMVLPQVHAPDVKAQRQDSEPAKASVVVKAQESSVNPVSAAPPAPGKSIAWSAPVAVSIRGPVFTRLAPPAHELMPVPAPAFVMLDEDNPDGEQLNLPPSTAALKVKDRRESRGVVAKRPVSALPVNDSDFAETMWIAQESRSLAEKKNIWLSYIAREKNKTYLNMGYYNFALVLANLVHETKDQALAQEAIDFYVAHETALRPQMTDQRFNRKLKALTMIAHP